MIGTVAVAAATAAAAAVVVGASATAVAGGSAAVAGSAHSSVVVVVAAAVPGRSSSAPSASYTITTGGILVAHTRRRRGASIGNDHRLSTMRRGSRNRRVLSRAGIVGIGRRRCRRRCCDRLTIGVDMKYLRLLLLVLGMATTTLLRGWRGAGMVLDGGVPVPVGHRRRRRGRNTSMAVRLQGSRGGRSGSIDVDGLHLPIRALRVVHGLRRRRLCLRLSWRKLMLLLLLLGSSACLTISYSRRRQMTVHLVLMLMVTTVGRHRGST